MGQPALVIVFDLVSFLSVVLQKKSELVVLILPRASDRTQSQKLQRLTKPDVAEHDLVDFPFLDSVNH